MVQCLNHWKQKCLHASFHSAGIYRRRFIVWKRPEIHLLFRQNLLGTILSHLLYGQRSIIPAVHSTFYHTVKNVCVWKYQVARTRKRDYLYVNAKNQSFLFKAHLRIMNRWMSEVKSTPHLEFFPAEGKHRCMAANLLAAHIRWVYAVP